MPNVRVLTWNVQGSRGLDVAAVAEVIGRARADVVALQEITRGQARRLAAAAGLAERWWVFKHWPVVTWPEGGAVLTPHRLVATGSFVMRPAPWWSWRRRVAVEATIARHGDRLAVIGTHLSPHDAGEHRRDEAALTVERAATNAPPPIICGDLNESPGEPAYQAITAAGWVDAWRAAHGAQAEQAGATNWTAGERRGRSPTQRLDYVFAPPGWEIVECTTGVEGMPLDAAAELSDHLPVTATLRPLPPGSHGR